MEAEVDRSKRLEEDDASLASLKLTITSYQEAQPSLLALKKSQYLTELIVKSAIADDDIERLCKDVVLHNTSLERLSLELCECTDTGAQSLAEVVQSSKNIKWLALMLNNVSEKGAKSLADALKRSALVGFSIYATQLDLYDHSIGDIGAMYFAEAMLHSTTLQSMCIAQNEVTNTGLEHIIKALGSSGVHSLDLHSNRINSEGAATLAAFLSSNTTLQHLVLDENHDIGNEGASHLALALCQNRTLRQLSLRSCGIGSKGAERFAATLSQNCFLKELDLCGNGLVGDNAVELLSRGLKDNKALCKLDISGCGLGDEGSAHLADALRVNTSLTHLLLHKNEISDGGAIALATALHTNTVLTCLVLTQNRLGGKGASALTACLKHNSTLTQLSLDPRPMSGGEPLVHILLDKNLELLKCRKLIRQLQQENHTLRHTVDTMHK